MSKAIVTIYQGEKGPVGRIQCDGRLESVENSLTMNYWVEMLLAQGMLGKSHEYLEGIEEDGKSIVTLVLSAEGITLKSHDEEISLADYDAGEVALLMQLAMQMLRSKETITLGELKQKLNWVKASADFGYNKLPI